MNISQNNNSDFGPDQKSMRELENLYKLNQYDSLEKKVRELINKYDKNTNLYNILGVTLIGQSKLNDAIKIFEKIIKIQPNFYFAYHNIGNALTDLSKLDEAKTYYQKCIKINPNYTQAYISLGKILLDLHKLDESVVVFKQALKLEPENGELHRHLSQVIKYEQTYNLLKLCAYIYD